MTERAVWREVNRPDGGVLEVLIDGEASGRALIFHHGTPGAAVWSEKMADAARDADLQLVAYSRPGYAGSTTRGRRFVADCVDDVSTVLDALGVNDFVTLGWSGGGPHALACAALMGDRCVAATTLASVAPHQAEGLDFLAGMGEENIEEFSAAVAGEDVVRPLLERFAKDLVTVQASQVAAALGGLVSDVDKRSLTGDFAEVVAQSFRRAVSRGIDGWLDDDLAFVGDWGFDLGAIRIPVAIWQGAEDHMVPFAHGQWLATHVSSARVHLFQDEGHLSLGVARLPEIVADLAALAEETAPARS